MPYLVAGVQAKWGNPEGGACTGENRLSKETPAAAAMTQCWQAEQASCTQQEQAQIGGGE